MPSQRFWVLTRGTYRLFECCVRFRNKCHIVFMNARKFVSMYKCFKIFILLLFRYFRISLYFERNNVYHWFVLLLQNWLTDTFSKTIRLWRLSNSKWSRKQSKLKSDKALFSRIIKRFSKSSLVLLNLS